MTQFHHFTPSFAKRSYIPAEITCPLALNLKDLPWADILILEGHLQYAASRLEMELEDWRNSREYFPGPSTRRFSKPTTLLQLAAILRDWEFFEFLARAVEEAVTEERSIINLSMLPLTSTRSFREFIEREYHRSRLAEGYVACQPFDPATQEEWCHALTLEMHFYSRLLEKLNRLIEILNPPGGSISAEPRLPLLFVSLPKTRITG
jgi:hypothetical protein